MRNTRSHNLTQGESSEKSKPLSAEELQRFSSLIAPNPKQFSGDRNRHRPRPNLYIETVHFDEHGEEHVETTAPRKVDGTTAIPAYLEAGSRQCPAQIQGYTGHPIRAVSLGYEEDDIVGWFDLDLDGGYPIASIGPTLAKAFGKGQTILHSGSGREGRYRLFGLLTNPLTVRRLNALLNAICTHLGYPPIDGSLEITPAYKHSRVPGGMGGCQRYNLKTFRRIGGQNQAAFIRATLGLDPIDLEAIAAELKIENAGIDTGFRRSRGRFDPYTRREPHRTTPRHIRREIAQGVREEGHRNKHTLLFVNDLLRTGHGLRRAVEKWIEYIESGRMDASRFIRRFGREALIKQAEKTVRHIYANAMPYGMPDPIPLSPRELSEVHELSLRVPTTRYTSPRRARKMAAWALSVLKATTAAGLPYARMHSTLWQAMGGTHYKAMRNALGIFKACTGYKSKTLVRSRQGLGSHDSEAYAISWSTSFTFDRVLPAPTYDLASAIRPDVDAAQDDRSIQVATPSPVVVSYPSFDPATRSPIPSPDLPDSSQLYVHHIEIHGKSTTSDRPVALQKDPSLPSSTQTDATQPLPRASLPSRRSPKKRPTSLRPASVLDERPKRPEWQIIKSYCAPCTPDMGIDEWFDACKAVGDEYKREKAEALKDQKQIEREHGIKPSLGKVASARFHELRKILGLKAWN